MQNNQRYFQLTPPFYPSSFYVFYLFPPEEDSLIIDSTKQFIFEI